MNIETLRTHLAPIIDQPDQFGVQLHAILRDESDVDPFRLDIENDAENDIKCLFVGKIKDLFFNNKELKLMDLSKTDERRNVVYHYDLEIPPELKVLNEIVGMKEVPKLNLKNKSLIDIKALIIVIGNESLQLTLYKTLPAINVFARTQHFFIKSKTRLNKIKDELLRITANFQMLSVANQLIINDLRTLEKYFGFHEVIKREAVKGIDAVSKIGIVDDVESLKTLLTDIKYARQLTKIANCSPVLLNNIPNTEIIKFCQEFPKLINKIKFSEDKKKIVLDSNVSKALFLKLLMDDFLESKLTNQFYESIAKDTIETSNEID